MWAAPIFLPELKDPTQSYSLMATQLVAAGLGGPGAGIDVCSYDGHDDVRCEHHLRGAYPDILPVIVPPSRALCPDAQSLRVARLSTILFTALTLVVAAEADKFGGVLSLLVILVCRPRRSHCGSHDSGPLPHSDASGTKSRHCLLDRGNRHVCVHASRHDAEHDGRYSCACAGFGSWFSSRGWLESAQRFGVRRSFLPRLWSGDAQMTITSDESLLAFYRDHATSDLLPFWWKAVDTHNGGIFTCFDNSGCQSGLARKSTHGPRDGSSGSGLA